MGNNALPLSKIKVQLHSSATKSSRPRESERAFMDFVTSSPESRIKEGPSHVSSKRAIRLEKHTDKLTLKVDGANKLLLIDPLYSGTQIFFKGLRTYIYLVF